MSKQCKIIEDLLPLYHDGVCSEESKQMIEEHLSQCEECRNLLSKIDGEIVSPAKDEDVKMLEGISKAVRKGRKKALIAGISITLVAFLLLFAGFSTWWYCHEYSYYSAFAEGQAATKVEENIKRGIKPTEMYTWSDDIYQYDVVVPDFLDIGGFVGMSRLDNNEAQTVELAVTRWENEKYIFHIYVNDAEKTRYFIIDSELNLYGNYSKEQMETKQEELIECKDTVQAIINDAIAMWPFID
jgi:hypothetical protein